MKLAALLFGAVAADWTFTWRTDSNPGGFGYTLYDENGNELGKRAVAAAGSGAGEEIKVASPIYKVLINGNNDGFHGQFSITNDYKTAEVYECTGCLGTSTSLLLGSLYLDGNQDGNTGRPNNANCANNCVFNLKAATTVEWTTTTSAGYWAMTALNRQNEVIHVEAQKYYASGTGTINIFGEAARIKFTSSSTDGWDGGFVVKVRGQDTDFRCTNCHPGSKSTAISGVYIDYGTTSHGVAGIAHCHDACEFVYDTAIYCPSTECWTYANGECTLNSGCVSVTCLQDKMMIFAKPAVLGNGEWDTVSEWTTKTDANGMYSTSCALSEGAGSCGAPKFESDNLAFTYQLIQHGSARTRSMNPNDNEISLAGGLTVITTPAGVGVRYKCLYSTTVSVSTADYNVQPVTIIGEETSTGTLDSGFKLEFLPPSIKLGQIADIIATWELTISSLSFHFVTCAVIHEAQSVNVIQDGCSADALGVTLPARGRFQFKTFRIAGSSGTAQKMKCDLKICDGTANCAKAATCPSLAGYNFQ